MIKASQMCPKEAKSKLPHTHPIAAATRATSTSAARTIAGWASSACLERSTFAAISVNPVVGREIADELKMVSETSIVQHSVRVTTNREHLKKLHVINLLSIFQNIDSFLIWCIYIVYVQHSM